METDPARGGAQLCRGIPGDFQPCAMGSASSRHLDPEWLTELQQNQERGPLGMEWADGKIGRKNCEHLAVALRLSWEACCISETCCILETSQADFHGGHQLPFSSCSAWCLGLAPCIYLVMLPHAPATPEPMPCGGGTCGDTTQRAAVNAHRHPKEVHIHTSEQEESSLHAVFVGLGTLVQSKLLSPMLNSSISSTVSAKGSPSSCTKSGITLYIRFSCSGLCLRCCCSLPVF